MLPLKKTIKGEIVTAQGPCGYFRIDLG